MVFKPDRRAGIISALIILLTIISIQALVVANVFDQRLGPGQFLTALLFLLTLPVLGLWAHWFHQLLTLSYHLDRDALVVRCGWFERTVPLRAVRRCTLGAEIQPDARFHGVSWPGFMRGHLHVRGEGRVQVYGTVPLAQQIVLLCDDSGLDLPVDSAATDDLTGNLLSIAISPRDQAAFMGALDADLAIGSLHEVPAGLAWRGIGAWPVWRDRLFWALAMLTLLSGLGLYAVLAWRYRLLPSRLPLHFGASGFADRIDLKERLIIVPLIGSLATLVNGSIGLFAHRRERMAALLLLGGTLGVMLVLWVALVGLIY